MRLGTHENEGHAQRACDESRVKGKRGVGKRVLECGGIIEVGDEGVVYGDPNEGNMNAVEKPA